MLAAALTAVLLSCSHPFERATADLVVATANLNASNTGAPAEITVSLLQADADVMVINEAVAGGNVDVAVLEEAGYAVHQVACEMSAFSITVAERVGGAAGVTYVPITAGFEMISIPVTTLRFLAGETPFTLIGIHIVPPFFFSEEERQPFFDLLAGHISNGRLRAPLGSGETGDAVIIAGDFNTLPPDPAMRRIAETGVVDTAVAGENPYAYSWPAGSPLVPKGRIDYVLVSGDVRPAHYHTFSIPGSDHAGITAGVTVP